MPAFVSACLGVCVALTSVALTSVAAGQRAAAPLAPAPLAPATTLAYSPATVTLHGTLRRVAHFGAPGFGDDPKHDARVHVLVLLLDTPVSVKADPHADPKHTANLSDFARVRSIQLELHDADEPRAVALVGKHLSATGKLNQAVAPGEYTPVTLTVEALRAE